MSVPRYLITGANGQLGQLVITELARRVGAEAVVALVRDPAPRGANLRDPEKGVPYRAIA